MLCIAAFSLPANAKDPINTTFFGNVAIEGYDPVAYFLQNQAVKGNERFELEWQGATWRFSSDQNQALFEANPSHYAPQYGGYCAYAVSQGSTAGIDPDQFTIVNNKLYLNYNAKIQKKWLENRDGFIEQANRNWPGVLD